MVVASLSAPPLSAFAQRISSESLERSLFELNGRLVGIGRAQDLLFGALLAGNGEVDEADLLARMKRRVADPSAGMIADVEAARGRAFLGARGAAVFERARAFHRDALAVFARRPPAEWRTALDELVGHYRSRRDVALPDVPKDMSILYDHPYTSLVPPTSPETEPRRQRSYPLLTGLTWAAHWYGLAAFEPLESSNDPADRAGGLATVAERYVRKLSIGGLPDGFPRELPLAPAIAPGLVMQHERTAAILDNFDLMLEVLTDVLLHPAVTDRRAAVDVTIAQFTERAYRCVQADEWIVVALRHSIFAQGGPALATMTTSDRNAGSGHGQHYRQTRSSPPCDPE